jgi:hypothetical protein
VTPHGKSVAVWFLVAVVAITGDGTRDIGVAMLLAGVMVLAGIFFNPGDDEEQ